MSVAIPGCSGPRVAARRVRPPDAATGSPAFAEESTALVRALAAGLSAPASVGAVRAPIVSATGADERNSSLA